jgi:hypothetical protein
MCNEFDVSCELVVAFRVVVWNDISRCYMMVDVSGELGAPFELCEMNLTCHVNLCHLDV